MNLIKLTEDQLNKLEEMYYLNPHDGYVLNSYALYKDWLEISLYYLLPRVAEIHGRQPYTTPNWSEHMVRQKIINELPTVNPIDTLYDIWKHPDKYAQTL